MKLYEVRAITNTGITVGREHLAGGALVFAVDAKEAVDHYLMDWPISEANKDVAERIVTREVGEVWRIPE